MAVDDEGLTYIASKARQDLIEHRTVEQVDALAAIQRQSFTKTPPLVGDGNILFLACSNYHKARYFEADFSAALVQPVPPGKSSHIRGKRPL